MRKNYKTATSYFAVLLLVTALLSACGNTKKDGAGDLNDKKAALENLKKEQRELTEKIAALEKDVAKTDTSATAVGKPKLVAIQTAGAAAFTHYIDLQGRIESVNISYVAPPNGQGGIVKALYVQKGQNVRKGQVLARLDDQLIRQQIDPLRVQLNAAEDTYRRTKNLWDQGIGTYQQVLTAQTQAETLRKQIALIQKQSALMTVTAPTSGVADEVNVRVGEMFVGNTAMGPQIRIVNTSDLKVQVQVPENYLGRIKVGTPVQVQLPNAGNRIINTKVSIAGKTIDPSSRSFYIEAPIPYDPQFKPNQIAVVKVQDYSTASALTIPLPTLQNDEEGKFVMIAVKEGDKLVARKRRIVTGELYDDRLEVKSGLQAGDAIITEGFQGLYEGQLLTTATNAG